jgi:hypothetical protein
MYMKRNPGSRGGNALVDAPMLLLLEIALLRPHFDPKITRANFRSA